MRNLVQLERFWLSAQPGLVAGLLIVYVWSSMIAGGTAAAWLFISAWASSSIVIILSGMVVICLKNKRGDIT